MPVKEVGKEARGARAPRYLHKGCARYAVLTLALACVVSAPVRALADADDVNRPILPPTPVVSSTVPANGDLNPYGVAFVPAGFPSGGLLSPGDILVSNFNDKANLQGTGSTIVKIGADGTTTLFFAGTPPLGLSTGLVILRSGFVIVANFPSSDGTCETAQAGSLLVIHASGNLVTNLTHPDIDGPWDMTADDDGTRASLFVSNALSGTVVRFHVAVGNGTVKILDSAQLASGYVHRCDAAAFVVSPTGLAFDDPKGVLYVASTGDNAVYALDHAETAESSVKLGRLIYEDAVHLHGPNGMVLGPCGHLFAAESDVINSDPNQPSEIVEFTTGGKFISQLSMDPAQGGAFGVGLASAGDDFIRFAAVDDNANNLSVWTLAVPECH